MGTVANQTWPKGLPVAATVNGDPSYDDVLSYLPGQRLSRCTCRGESHPGPVHADTGEYVGRSAPEIDMFEAQVRLSDSPQKQGECSIVVRLAILQQESTSVQYPNPVNGL